jgi:hypothetical protein
MHFNGTLLCQSSAGRQSLVVWRNRVCAVKVHDGQDCGVGQHRLCREYIAEIEANTPKIPKNRSGQHCRNACRTISGVRKRDSPDVSQFL